MDPVSALGAAAAAVQFVDFSYKLLSRSRAARANSNYFDVDNTTEKLQKLSIELRKQLSTSADKHRVTSRNDEDIQQLCEDCSTLTDQLLEALRPLMRKTESKWASFLQALRTVWKEQEVQAMVKRLGVIREQLVFNIVVSLRQRDDAVLEEQSRIGNSLQRIEEGIRGPSGSTFLNDNHIDNRWKVDLIEAIFERRAGDGRDERRSREFWQSVSATDRYHYSTEKFLEDLEFEDMTDRQSSIPEAFKDTLQWVYDDPSENLPSWATWASFAQWLAASSGPSLYWITGKAGSGKSTLIKYLVHNTRTIQFLRTWSKEDKLLLPVFYFWNSGTPLQKSYEGLLRTLLHYCFLNHPDLIPIICPERWDASRLFCPGKCTWSQEELLGIVRAFVDTAVQDSKMCFFIDGLDEFPGTTQDQGALIHLLRTMSETKNVKICVSSRPWPIFRDSFSHGPSLLLENLTFRDMQHFVHSVFDDSPGFVELKRKDQTFSLELENSIVEKSLGVWLWLHFVVQGLLEDFLAGARISDIRKTVASLPSELELLFRRMLDSLQPFQLEQASQLFQIVEAAKEPLTLLSMSFAEEETSEYALSLPCAPLSRPAETGRIQTTSRRINHVTKGLLEVSANMSNDSIAGEHLLSFHLRIDPGRTQETLDDQIPDEVEEVLRSAKVRYLHRTVRDFIRSHDTWLFLCGQTRGSFDADIALTNALLCQLKTAKAFADSGEAFAEILHGFLGHGSKAEAKSDHLAELLYPLASEFEGVVTRRRKEPNPKFYSDPPSYDTFINMFILAQGSYAIGLSRLSGYDLSVPVHDIPFVGLAILFNLRKFVLKKVSEKGFPIEPDANQHSLLNCALGWPGGLSYPIDVDLVRALLTAGANPNRHRTSTNNQDALSPWEYLLNSARSIPNVPVWSELIPLYLKYGADPKLAYRVIDQSPRVAKAIRMVKKEARATKWKRRLQKWLISSHSSP